MSTSFDDDGTKKKICDEGPDGEELWIPNCFHGDVGLTGPTAAVGTNDVSIEFWLKFTHFGGGGDNDSGAVAVGWEFTNPNFLHPEVGVNFWSAFQFWEGYFSAATEVDLGGGGGGLPYWQPGWLYVVANYDRSDLMSFYLNGTLVRTSDISPQVASDLGTLRFFPFSSDGNEASYTSTPQIPGDDTNGPFPGIVGPVATHFSLLTSAQMADSIARRDVQDLATTQFIYRWRDITFDGVEEKWDFNRLHASRRVADVSTIRYGLPVGTNGTIYVPNSATGKDTTASRFNLTTEEEYGEVINANFEPLPHGPPRASVAFASDPFFQSGGGLDVDSADVVP